MAGEPAARNVDRKIQRWIATALICAVSSFPIGALIITTHTRDTDTPNVVILCIMNGAIGIVAVVAIRLIQHTPPGLVFSSLADRGGP